jgi:hypothetical protein
MMQSHGMCMNRRVHGGIVLLLLAVLIAGSIPPAALAQIQDGATMTVLRGQVAVVRGDGTAMQPAPSGTVVHSGDEIRTLTQSGGTITFFVGTEIELGEETTLTIEQAERDGERIDISLKQVFGVSLHRVHALTNPSSRYRVEIGGAVAVARGPEFQVYGPTNENVVGIVCLDDCAEQTRFAGCPMGPRAFPATRRTAPAPGRAPGTGRTPARPTARRS